MVHKNKLQSESRQGKIATFWRASKVNKLAAFGIVFIVAVIGVAVAFVSASGFFAANEPEQGTRTANAQLVTDASASGGQAIQFTAPTAPPPPPPTGSCAVSTSHVPDGPDGMGGCWPGPSNTGPNAAESTMATYTGSCNITTTNAVIDSKVINCSPLVVSAPGLVVKNSYLKGGVGRGDDTIPFTIQDSLLDNNTSTGYACGDPNNTTTDCGVTGSNFTILRTEIMHTNRAAYCQDNCTIKDSYFHGTNLQPIASNLAHASSVRNEQNLTLNHNTIACDYTGPFPNGEIGCSADMSGYPDFTPIRNDTIIKNLFMSNNAGIAFCAYGGGTAGKPFSSDPTNATNIVFENNIFQRGANGKCGANGPITDYINGRSGNSWCNNKYDNGTLINSTWTCLNKTSI